MAKHNALEMFGRSGNPALSDSTFRSEGIVTGQSMTLQGTVNKTGILLGILVLTAVYTWNLFFQTGNPESSDANCNWRRYWWFHPRYGYHIQKSLVALHCANLCCT